MFVNFGQSPIYRPKPPKQPERHNVYDQNLLKPGFNRCSDGTF